ncbi:MAG: hypothetical protein PF444_00315, partial [Bacteroidales bacterium]|nr:hypothetical protein [Bacteroidales bacterium]
MKNKDELKAIAADVFSRYNKAKKVSVTSDGMAFITDESDLAVKNHSKKNRTGKELSITPFLRDEKDASKPKTAEELIKIIEAETDVKAVEALANLE